MENNYKLKVFIVDDHEIFVLGLTLILENMDFVNLKGSSSNGKEFIEKLKTHKFDIVLMDVDMPEMDGIEATRRALRIDPGLKVIALSNYDTEEYVRDMLQAGAKGYLLKNVGQEELEKALLSVAGGSSYFSSKLSSLIIGKLFIDRVEKDSIKQRVRLTSRETEVLKLICDGLTNAEIGEKLFISQRTVEGHRANLFKKIGVNSTAGLIKYAIKEHIADF